MGLTATTPWAALALAHEQQERNLRRPWWVLAVVGANAIPLTRPCGQCVQGKTAAGQGPGPIVWPPGGGWPQGWPQAGHMKSKGLSTKYWFGWEYGRMTTFGGARWHADHPQRGQRADASCLGTHHHTSRARGRRRVSRLIAEVRMNRTGGSPDLRTRTEIWTT